MSSQQNCDEKKMTEADFIREVYPRHSMKMLARLIDVPIDTARHWLYRNFSAARRRELALGLLEEMDRQDQRRAGVRRQLQAMAYGDGSQEMGNAGDGVAIGETRLSRAARVLAKKAAE